jgi:hypothetical protein
MKAAVAAGMTALFLCACGSPPPAPAPTSDAPAEGAPRAFDLATADSERPCTMLTPQDAVTLTGKAYYSTLALNQTEGDGVRCAYGVGKGGLSAKIEILVHFPTESGAQHLMAVCVKDAKPAPLPAPGCMTESAAYATFSGGRVIVAKVTGALGDVDQARSMRLATWMGERFAQEAARP